TGEPARRLPDRLAHRPGSVLRAILHPDALPDPRGSGPRHPGSLCRGIRPARDPVPRGPRLAARPVGGVEANRPEDRDRADGHPSLPPVLPGRGTDRSSHEAVPERPDESPDRAGVLLEHPGANPGAVGGMQPAVLTGRLGSLFLAPGRTIQPESA